MDPSEAKVLEPQFIKIYHDLIEEETQLNPDSLTRSSLKKLRKAYSKKVRQRGTSIVSFASASTRCAYIYQYCPCFTSAVAFHFSQMLHKNPTLLANIICQDTLTVCCLGGGPAAEIVAISMVLEKVLQQNDHHRQKPLIINAVIVDNDAGWICTMNNVIDKLNQHLDQSIVHLSCRFMESDLMKPLTGEVKEVVRNSDVVTMIKFLSAVLGPTEETEGTRLVQVRTFQIFNCILHFPTSISDYIPPFIINVQYNV